MAVPRRGPLARLVLVALLSVSISIAWAAPVLGSQCDRHAASHTTRHLELASTVSWAQGTQHECSHCPPSECSRAVPCAATSSIALGQATRLVAEFPAKRTTMNQQKVHPRSTSQEPPTPPPQRVT
jgi:hypothetical protein